jgi:predicted nicotinamide N-methyase
MMLPALLWQQEVMAAAAGAAAGAAAAAGSKLHGMTDTEVSKLTEQVTSNRNSNCQCNVVEQ